MTTPSTFSLAGRVLLVLFGALFVWLAIDLLLLVFMGILAAIFLRSISYWLSERTPLKNGSALAVVLLALLGSTLGVGLFVAPSLAEQTQELVETLPGAVSTLEERVRQNRFGDWVLDRALGSTAPSASLEGRGGPRPLGAEDRQPRNEQDGEGETNVSTAQDMVVDQAKVLAPQVMHGFVGLVIVLFTAVYLAADPHPYIRGALRLFPQERRERMGEVLYACGYTLQWWLFGQLIAMAVVGIMMGVGLALIGIPLAFALGVMAGLFEFIPTVGPMLALLPALLLALTQSANSAVWVLALFAFMQTVEGYLLTPLVQQRTVHLPPIVTITAQVFFAWTLGPVGLLVAVPLVAVGMVMVQMLYVQDFLGDDMEVEAEDEGRAAHAEAAPLEGEA